jgi:hypothetical protein
MFPKIVYIHQLYLKYDVYKNYKRYCNFRRRLKLKLPSEPIISREYPSDGHTGTNPPSHQRKGCTEWRGRQLQSKGDSTIMHHRR